MAGFSIPPIRQVLPPSRRYALFISHAWDYTDEYQGLVNLLNSDPTFVWENLSASQAKPLSVLFHLPRSYRYMVRQIDDLVSRADCVLVLAGMYAAHRGWIQSEIEAAQDLRKPIVAVEPRGNERFPDAVMHANPERVGWNSASIISAIRRLAAPTVPLGPARVIPPY